jgi:hypothetical protein
MVPRVPVIRIPMIIWEGNSSTRTSSNPRLRKWNAHDRLDCITVEVQRTHEAACKSNSNSHHNVQVPILNCTSTTSSEASLAVCHMLLLLVNTKLIFLIVEKLDGLPTLRDESHYSL